MPSSLPGDFEGRWPRPPGYAVIAPYDFADFIVLCLRVLYGLDRRHMDN